MTFLPRPSMSVAFETTSTLNTGIAYGPTDPVVFPGDSVSQVQTEVLADQDGTITFQFYADDAGTDLIRTITVPYLASDGYRQFGAPTFGRSARYTFLNDSGTNQTDFYFTTKVLTGAVSPQVLALDAFVSPTMLATVHRSVLTGQNPSGRYGNVARSEQGHLEIALRNPLDIMGALSIDESTPLVQIDATDGIIDTDTQSYTGASGTVTESGGLFICDCETSVGGYGFLESIRTARSRPGQSMRARFNAIFPASGTALYLSGAGVITGTDGLYVGHKNGVFGFTRRIAGAAAIYRLTLTNGATSGSGDITITLNSVATVVAVVSSDTEAVIARKIAATAFTAWTVYQNGATVTFVYAGAAAVGGTYSFTDTDTTGAAATGPTVILAGAANDSTTGFTARTAWNVDRLDGSNSALNPSGLTLVETNLNEYEIRYAPGAHCILLYVMNPVTTHYALCHVVEYPNSAVVPSQVNPSFRLAWFSASEGSSTSLVVKGQGGVIDIDGVRTSRRNPFAIKHTASSINAEVQLISLRNRAEFQSRVNQRVIKPQSVTVALEGTKAGVVSIFLGATLSAATNWGYKDEARSCAEYEDTNTVTVSGGQLIGADAVSGGGSVSFDLSAIDIEPTDVLTVTGLVNGGSGADMLVTVNWEEV